MIPNPRATAESAAHTKSLAALVLAIIRHPWRTILLWNWKNAVLSVVLRGPIFLVVSARHGWKATVGALLTESIFCAATAGFYGTVVQTLKDAEPEWLAGVVLAGVVPFIFQVLEYLLHWLRGTPHLFVAEVISFFVGGISALFNWYAMRRGTFLVGGEGGRFGRDLTHLPRLLFGFFVMVPYRLANDGGKRFLGALTGRRRQAMVVSATTSRTATTAQG